MAEARPLRRVLVVDDEDVNRDVLEAYLEPLGCEILLAANGRDALEIVERARPDVVLTDAMMPVMDGFELCRQIRDQPGMGLLPVVMITALSQVQDRVRALDIGTNDFLTKPVDRLEVQARVRSLLRLKAAYDELDDTESVIYALAQAVDAKDSYTEAHTVRVAGRSRELGISLGLDGKDLEDLYRGGMIHDIGKIGVPDAVLLKPGKLDTEEWEIMRRHPVIGEQIARPLRSAANLLAIIRHHHENFDGTGYPDGLAGGDIPLLARITAISDAYDAMVSDRPYRHGMPGDKAVSILNGGAGGQWDPELVPVFVAEVLAPGRQSPILDSTPPRIQG